MQSTVKPTNESFNDQKNIIFIFITQYNYSHALEKKTANVCRVFLIFYIFFTSVITP